MNNSKEIVKSEVESTLEAPIWIDISVGILEVVALTLVIVAATYLFIKNARPGSLMILIGVVFAVIFGLLPLLINDGLELGNSAKLKIIWLTQLVSSFFIFLTGYGFLRLVLSLQKRR